MLCHTFVQQEVQIHVPSEIALFVTQYATNKNCECVCHGGQQCTLVGCQVVSSNYGACCAQCTSCFLPCAHCLKKPACNKLGKSCPSCSRLLCHLCQFGDKACPVKQCKNCETAKSRCKSCLSHACSKCKNKSCKSCDKKTCKHCLSACIRCKEFFCSLCRKDFNGLRPQRKICFGCDLETLKRIQLYERAKLSQPQEPIKKPVIKKRKMSSSSPSD